MFPYRCGTVITVQQIFVCFLIRCAYHSDKTKKSYEPVFLFVDKRNRKQGPSRLFAEQFDSRFNYTLFRDFYLPKNGKYRVRFPGWSTFRRKENKRFKIFIPRKHLNFTCPFLINIFQTNKNVFKKYQFFFVCVFKSIYLNIFSCLRVHI